MTETAIVTTSDADPRVAIAAMQAMNGSVRNAVFFPAFFLTPLVVGLGAFLEAHDRRDSHSSKWQRHNQLRTL